MGEACIKWAWKKSEGHRLKILILLIWSVIALLIGAAVDNILGTEDSAPIIISVSLIVAGVAYWKPEPFIRLATKILPNRANQEYSSPDLEARQAQLEEFAAERNGDSETTDENKRILEQHVRFQLASGNWNVYSKSDTSAILWRNKKVNHVVHAILAPHINKSIGGGQSAETTKETIQSA